MTEETQKPRLIMPLNTARDYFVKLIQSTCLHLRLNWLAVVEQIAVSHLEDSPSPTIDDVEWTFRTWTLEEPEHVYKPHYRRNRSRRPGQPGRIVGPVSDATSPLDKPRDGKADDGAGR